MIHWPPSPVLLSQLLPHALWTIALLLLLASLGCIVATLRSPRRPLVYCAAGLLALAVVVVLLPAGHAPLAFRVLIGIVALALAILGGGPVAQLALALSMRTTTVPSPHGGIFVPALTPAGEPTTREVLRGGTTIGILERLATAGTIMAGFPEGLAVLIAIKGVGRFTELEESESRERFIIGTLASIIWACVCAGVFRIVAG